MKRAKTKPLPIYKIRRRPMLPNYKTCHVLTPAQLSDLETLSRVCRAAEPITLSFPAQYPEAERLPYHPYHLLYLGDRLISALSILPMDEETCEAMALTAPDCRRRGYFSLLLEHALDEFLCYEEAPDLAFTTDVNSPDALLTLKALECEYWYSELMLSLPFPVPTQKQTAPSAPHLFRRHEEGEVICFELWLQGGCEQPAGTCYVLDFGAWYYLYGLEVQTDLRRRGFGRALVSHVLSCLNQEGRTKLKLQVSSQNTAALALYHSLGFAETERIDYYLY